MRAMGKENVSVDVSWFLWGSSTLVVKRLVILVFRQQRQSRLRSAFGGGP